MEWSSWVLGIVGAVITASGSALAALVWNHERRLSHIEQNLESTKIALVKMETQVGSLNNQASHILVSLARIETKLEMQHESNG